MGDGDILGHEPMGIVEEVGSEVDRPEGRRPGRHAVQHLLRHCWMCDQGLHTQCETTQVRDQGMGAALFGYTKLYGAGAGRPGGVPARAAGSTFCPIKVPEGPPDDRFVYLSDVLPTAWQAVEYADVPDGGTARRARPRPDRRHGLPDRPCTAGQPRDRRRPRARAARARRARRGVEVLDLTRRDDDLGDAIREHDRRPRPRRGHRRRRHGGARLAGRQARADRSPASCPTRSRRR